MYKSSIVPDLPFETDDKYRKGGRLAEIWARYKATAGRVQQYAY